MFCSSCGAPMEEGQKFCAKCGAKLEIPPAPGNSRQSGGQAPVPGNSRPTGVEAPVPGNSRQSGGQAPALGNGRPAGGQAPAPGNGKSRIPLIAGIAAAAVVVLAVLGVVFWNVLSPKEAYEEADADAEVWEEDSEEQTADEEKDNDRYASSKEPQSGTSLPDHTMFLREAVAAAIKEKGSLMGEYEELYFEQDYNPVRRDGVLGAVLEDLDGDGKKEAVVVYLAVNRDMEDSQVLADIYKVENGDIAQAANGLVLADSVGVDVTDINVYLKRTEDGYRLIGDSYMLYWHWADAGIWNLYAYDCTSPVFAQMAAYGVAGSDLSEADEREHVDAAHDAGLVKVSQGLSYGPLLVQDSDIRMICNIRTDIFDNVTYYTENGPTGAHYGTMYFTSYVTADYELDDDRTTDFVEKELLFYGSTSDADGEYIFADSSTRRLTDDDLAPIAGDADLLRKARNEIYARHGRMFQDEELQAYFNAKSWYVPSIEADDFSDDMLSDLEKDNCSLIQEYEERLR